MAVSLHTVIKNILKVVLPLGVGLVILWAVYRDMDFASIMEVWHGGVKLNIILISLLFGLFANIIRGFRWKLLITPLGENPKTSNLVYAVLGNYVMNFVLPRLGEVWRCGVITQYEKISFTKLFGTLLIDRLADTLAVGLIVVFCFFLNISFFESFLAGNPEILAKFQAVLTSPWLYTCIVLIILLIWSIFKYLGNHMFVKKAKGALANVWEGIKTVWYMKQKWTFLFYTVLIWSGYFMYFYLCFFAFDFTENLGWQAGLTTFAMSSVAVAAPVQAGMGAWHFMVIAALVGYGVGGVNAKSFAFIIFAIQSLWTALTGLFGVVALPILNKNRNVKEKYSLEVKEENA